MATAEHETNGADGKGHGSANTPGPRDNAPGRSPRPVVEYRDGWEQSVPQSLIVRRQWVVWSFEWRDGKSAVGGPKPKPATPGKWTKVLYQPEAPVSKARSDAPKTWSSFHQATQAWKREQNVFDGIGYVFSKDDPFCGIDFDACLDDASQPHKWAADLLSLTSDTYREVSPSGRGVKAIVSADLGDRKGTNARGIGGKDNPGSAIEIYDRGRFFAITGSAWGECPSEIVGAKEGQTIADAVYAHIQAVRAERDAEKKRARSANRKTGARSGASNGHLLLGRPPVDDQQLLYLARTATNGDEFSALFDRGDLSSYTSDSEADGALCCHLAFWTQKDPGRMEALWLASALGQRGKVVDRPDYRALTIATAIEKTDAVYRPMPRPPIPIMPETVHRGQAHTTLNATDEIPWTDRGLAERVVKLYGHAMRYCQPWKKWLIWDGTRWKTDDTLQIDRFIKATIRRMQVEEIATIADPESKESFLKWAVSCESRRSHDAAKELARGEDGIPVIPAKLDSNVWLFNCANGTIDLRTGELKPHSQTDLITKLCPFEYHPDAKASLWDSVLDRFLPNRQLQSWLRRFFGYAISGVVREHALPVFFGTGANGKSTILNTLLDVFGEDYGLKAPPDMLLVKSKDSHPTERAVLFGKRLVIAIETEEGRRFNESLVKELTGGDKITARRMREDFWSFAPSHKIVLATNHKPSVKGTDHGIWRRLKLVEFGVSIDASEQDTSVPDRLMLEADGILASCVQSCIEWQKEGLKDPSVIQDATKGYRDEEDTLAGFIEDNCVHGNHIDRIPAGELYSSYKGWAEFNGYAILSAKRFGKSIRERGFESTHSGGKYYVGINLKHKFPMLEEEEQGYEIGND